MTDIHLKFVEMANKAKADVDSRDKHNWSAGIFNIFRLLANDTKGAVGEDFVVWLITETGRKAERVTSTDPTDDPYDIVVTTDDITLEVKTATLSRSSNNFQHEGLEQNRRCDGMVFLDISPNEIYITCFCKHTFDWNATHRRRHGIQIKKDLTLKMLKEGNHEIKGIADFERHYSSMLADIRRARPKQKK